jgi:hypothetical protein
MLAHKDECFPGLDAPATELACRNIYANRITAKLIECPSDRLLYILHAQILGLILEDAPQKQVRDVSESDRHRQGFLQPRDDRRAGGFETAALGESPPSPKNGMLEVLILWRAALLHCS